MANGQILEQIKAALSKTKTATDEEKGRSLALVEKLKAMDSEYKKATAAPKPDLSAIPQSLGLQPKVFVPKTDDEIVEAAETALLPAYEQKTGKLASDADQAISKLESSAQNAQADFEGKISNLEMQGDNRIKQHSDRMIVQGIVNSSVYQTGLDDISGSLITQMSQAKSALDIKLLEIEGKITQTRLGLEQALYQYDLQYAAGLEAKVNSLRLEQEKLKEEVNTYNKKIAEQELKYGLEREKKIAEIQAEHIKQTAEQQERQKETERELGYSGAKAEEMENRYKLALDTYNNLDKDVALDLINKQNAELKQTLGLYYQRLINAIMNK